MTKFTERKRRSKSD